MTEPAAAHAPHVVILGAGFGGLQAALGLRHAPVRVTLVDRRNHHLFQPLLYQVATAALSPADIAYPIRSILRHQANADVILGEAVSVDPEKRELRLADGVLPYDYLILAAGATHAYFGHEEWEAVAPGLKNLDDALEIRRRILLAFEAADRETDPAVRRALLTFVVVGAGPTGVELAGAIGEISRHVLVDDFRHIDPREAKIVLVEAGPRILATYTEQSARNAEASLRERGVEIRVSSPVTQVDAGGVVVGANADGKPVGGERIAAKTTLWAAGVAASPIAKGLGGALDRSGRVVVEPDLSVPGHPEIFVLGDLALYQHQGGRPLPGLSPVAMQQGRYAARAVLARLRGETMRPFHYFDKGTMAVIGRGSAVAEIAGLRLRGLLAWLAWCFVHIFYLIGFRNRFVVMFEWAWAYASYQRGARLITGNIDAYLERKR
ncbi:MAG TPA: NAD(P)/FAD-dependent oxidoreductase [Thermoanaerobaculia bacterium]|jgi:NADH dehydrogenase